MEYDLEEIEDLQETICFDKENDLFIGLSPDSSKNHLAYFTVTDRSLNNNPSKIARIRIDKPEYIYKKGEELDRWILTKKDIDIILTLLNKHNKGYINEPLFYFYMIDRFNGLCQFTETKEINVDKIPDYKELLINV